MVDGLVVKLRIPTWAKVVLELVALWICIIVVLVFG